VSKRHAGKQLLSIVSLKNLSQENLSTSLGYLCQQALPTIKQMDGVLFICSSFVLHPNVHKRQKLHFSPVILKFETKSSTAKLRKAQ